MHEYEKLCEDIVKNFDNDKLKNWVNSIMNTYGMAVIDNDREAIIALGSQVRFAMVMMDIMINAKRSEISDSIEREVYRLNLKLQEKLKASK